MKYEELLDCNAVVHVTLSQPLQVLVEKSVYPLGRLLPAKTRVPLRALAVTGAVTGLESGSLSVEVTNVAETPDSYEWVGSVLVMIPFKLVAGLSVVSMPPVPLPVQDTLSKDSLSKDSLSKDSLWALRVRDRCLDKLRELLSPEEFDKFVTGLAEVQQMHERLDEGDAARGKQS